jgi:hypothetical protein
VSCFIVNIPLSSELSVFIADGLSIASFKNKLDAGGFELVFNCIRFLSIRLERNTERLKRWAEMIFLLGLVSMTLIMVIFSFEVV